MEKGVHSWKKVCIRGKIVNSTTAERKFSSFGTFFEYVIKSKEESEKIKEFLCKNISTSNEWTKRVRRLKSFLVKISVRHKN